MKENVIYFALGILMILNIASVNDVNCVVPKQTASVRITGTYLSDLSNNINIDIYKSTKAGWTVHSITNYFDSKSGDKQSAIIIYVKY